MPTGRSHPHGWASFHAMRREAACVAVLGVLTWCAAPASAAPTPVAQWTLDEGVGQVAGDTSGHASHGQLGSTAGADAADPTWTAGHAGGGALDFNGSTYVTVPDTGLLELSATRGRRMGAPHRLAGPLALRALQGLARL